MRPIFIAIIVVVAVLALLTAVVVGVVLYRAGHDVQRDLGVTQALERHQAELRAVPGVAYLGTHVSATEPPHIVVYVEKVTPEIRAAVPATLGGCRVDVEQEPVLPPEPPLLQGTVESTTPATDDQAAAGLAGVIVVKGDLYERGMGESPAVPRTVAVRVPAGVSVWKPQGEGKEFVDFSAIRVGDMVQVTLTAVPSKRARKAAAADVEVYGRP